jgi:hypothetical protein
VNYNFIQSKINVTTICLNTYTHFYAPSERDSRVIINICRGENCLRKKVVEKYRSADKSLARPGRKQLRRQKIVMIIYPIYYRNWRNISTIYIHNKTSIKRNILIIKHSTSRSRSG